MNDDKAIIKATFYGLYIYRHILQSFYPNEEVLKVENKDCLPTRNPYNKNKPTLIIYRGEYEYLYRDEELKKFEGGPLDFAAFHYKLKGKELLQKINEEMKLNILKPEFFAQTKKGKESENAYINALPKFTYFRAPISNIKPYKDVNVLDVYKVVKGDYFEKRTAELRTIADRLTARSFKARNFDYVCFSGTFSKRGDQYLKLHSGMMVLDFDHLDNWQQVKQNLLADPFFDTELLFRSPSGNGLKWLVTIDVVENSQENWFNAIAAYLKTNYGLIADKSGKDLSRACFLPYDPDIYINPQYLGPEYG